jgi:hypothetical protein
MTINILEHLENIKIFTDYINSGLDTIEMFWEHIDKGQIVKKYKIKTIKYDVDKGNYEPSEIEFEKLKEGRERKESIDFSEEYIKAIRGAIESKLEYDKAEIPETIEVHHIYETIIKENENLEHFLKSSKEIFDQYVKIIDGDLPKYFFSKLSQFEKDNAVKPIDYQSGDSKINKSNNFSGLEWGAIFYYATNYSPNTNYGFKKGDLMNFMDKHQIDKKYKYLRKQCFIALNRINKENNYPIAKLNKIIPFLKVNYPQAISKVNNDINIITEETTDF